MSDASSPWIKLALLVVLVLQNTLSALLGRYTRQAMPVEELYDISQFILISEILKLNVCFIIEACTTTSDNNTFKTHLVDHPKEMFKMAIPAVLYWGSNTLLYVAISNLEVPIFQVSYQAKLVVTAIVSVIMLGRRYALRQWVCLVVISIAVASLVVEEQKILEAANHESQATTSQQEVTTANSLMVGLAAVALACFLSSLAGVYFEKVLKKTSTNDSTHKNQDGAAQPSLWMRNIQLAFFSVLVAYANRTFFEDSNNLTDKPFLHGFTPYVWCQVLLFGGGGLLVSAVIKYADNVLKGLATGISVLLSSMASIVLYNTSLSLTYIICAAATVTSVYFFNKSECPQACTSLCNSGTGTKFLFLGCLIVLNLSVLSTFTSQFSDMGKEWTEKSSQEEVSVATPLMETDWFPKDWNTTEQALSALRSVQDKITERAFHEATHVLYDLRTHLGKRPVKYLEIGSYTGISASLMLSHPFPTFVTMVDPCALPKTHFQGSMTQEQTIRKNLNSLHPARCMRTNPTLTGVAKTWDLRVGYSPAALPVGETFDIIFIDGDHSTAGVWKDYTGTKDLLRPGGFMVFDDYLDWKHSPEVRGAVDSIATQTDLVPLGTPRNIHGIHPEANASFINEFIFQKPGKTITNQPVPGMENASPLLCVAVATYRRKDGSTPLILERLWKMLEGQSYSNWKLYLTGDSYENEDEWKSLSFYNDSRASLYNLPEPGERGKVTGRDLWHIAGAAAVNNAIERLLADGHEWNVHLDDDDQWSADHLQNIVLGIRTGATFVMTECQFGGGVLPRFNRLPDISHTVLPAYCVNIHSSIAFNAAKLPVRYRFRPGVAGDGYMWQRVVYEESFYPAFVPIMSCYHMEERGNSKGGAALTRKSTLNGVELPPGWHNDETIPGGNDAYYALATKEFPSNLSRSCSLVVGPETSPQNFNKLAADEIPFFIREVKAFAGLPVWKLRGA